MLPVQVLNFVFSIQILNVIFSSPGVLRLGPETIAKKNVNPVHGIPVFPASSAPKEAK
jgi:hypothetical protein